MIRMQTQGDGTKLLQKTKQTRQKYLIGSKIYKDNKLREFHFKCLYRIVVAKKKLFLFNIKPDSNCVFCGGKDFVDYTFIECQFTKSFTQELLQWFNVNNSSNFILMLKMFSLAFSLHQTHWQINWIILFSSSAIIFINVCSKIIPHYTDFINKRHRYKIVNINSCFTTKSSSSSHFSSSM